MENKNEAKATQKKENFCVSILVFISDCLWVPIHWRLKVDFSSELKTLQTRLQRSIILREICMNPTDVFIDNMSGCLHFFLDFITS